MQSRATTKMTRSQTLPAWGRSRGGLFRNFSLFILLSQMPLYFFLLRGSRRHALIPYDVDVETMALVMNNDVVAAPKKIVVLGDHSSGIGFISDVLKNAFGDDVAEMHEILQRHDVLSQTEVDAILERKDILWIMVARSPCEWADAMINANKQICLETKSTRQECSTESTLDYYTLPRFDWQERQDPKATKRIIPNKVGQGSEYSHLFSLRFAKLSIMKQIMVANPRHSKIVQLRKFERNPNVLVKELEKEYLFQRTDSSTIYPASENSHEIACRSFDEWGLAQQSIDWPLEGYFGHTKFDCHFCKESFSPGSNPTNIYLLGERNSGTTFVSDSLAKAFDPPNTLGNMAEMFSSEIPVLLYKHMFRHDLLNETELAEIKRRDNILWVMVVRSPCDWAEAMFRKPYHACSPKHPERCGPNTTPIWINHNNLIGVQLVDFFTTLQWIDWAESTHFMRVESIEYGKLKKVDPYAISKPGTNYTYRNVFALRRHKLKLMKQILDVVPQNVKFVRLNEFEQGPDSLIDDLVKEFSLKVKEEYIKPEQSYFHNTQCLTTDEWHAAQNEIDWGLEAEFGFSPHDCRMCYGYTKSLRLHKRVKDQRKRDKHLQPGGYGKRGRTEKE